MNRDSAGLDFSDDGKKLQVWRIPDVATADAVGMKVGSKYAVLLNRDLSQDARTELVQQLGLED